MKIRRGGGALGLIGESFFFRLMAFDLGGKSPNLSPDFKNYRCWIWVKPWKMMQIEKNLPNLTTYIM